MKTILKQLESFRHILGHHVHVHSSLKAVGEVEGRGEALLSGLIDFFTQNGGMITLHLVFRRRAAMGNCMKRMDTYFLWE